MIKAIAFIVLTVACACTTIHAETLAEANVQEDLRSILRELRFVSGETSWRGDGVTTQAGVTVSSGSAYSVFEAPSPDPDDYTKLAAQIRDGFFRIYGLKASGLGSGGIQTAAEADRFGRASGTWRSSPNPEDSKESIRITVEVIPLRSARIGILVNYIHVHPSA